MLSRDNNPKAETAIHGKKKGLQIAFRNSHMIVLYVSFFHSREIFWKDPSDSRKLYMLGSVSVFAALAELLLPGG